VDYATFVFDCDGVVLDSNKVKTEAFRQAAMPYGHEAANALVAYHVANGGISRYRKFECFLSEIAPKDVQGPNLENLLQRFGRAVVEGLETCDIAPGLAELRQATRNARWLIVSGGDQGELRDVFARRELSEMFDGGIFGSPDTKEQILHREISSGNILKPALFLGDSKYDFHASTHAGIDFIFLSMWTEVEDWHAFTQTNSIRTFHDLEQIKELVYQKIIAPQVF